MNILKFLPKLAVALGLVVVLAGCGVNAIPTKDQAVKAAWANVQAAYQRRADLIPNLANTVAGFAAQEKSVLTAVTQARASATQPKFDASTITDPQKFAQFQAAQDKLSGVLGRLMMITENYPELRSNQNFLALQSQLEGTENRIEIARRDYNAAVQDYNTELVTIPGSLWASTFYKQYKQAVPFAAAAGAQTAPVVNFNTSTAPAPSPAAAQPGPQPTKP
ncbi:MAG TPA: LemA family protein [Rhizomicrobium sp.]|jgi:LemA protein|nr:LemA family protein [Rhizomicrobium sp.]